VCGAFDVAFAKLPWSLVVIIFNYSWLLAVVRQCGRVVEKSLGSFLWISGVKTIKNKDGKNIWNGYRYGSSSKITVSRNRAALNLWMMIHSICVARHISYFAAEHFNELVPSHSLDPESPRRLEECHGELRIFVSDISWWLSFIIIITISIIFSVKNYF